MKKLTIFLITLILIISTLSVSAFAKTYSVSETDVNVNINDSMWYIFTRDNIKDNPELDELGMSYDMVYNLLHNNQAYMYAILFTDENNGIEFFVRKTNEDPGIVNLSNYSEKEVLELAEEIAKKQKSEDFSVYQTQYKFAQLEYEDSKLNYFINEFFTVVNKESYTFTFQSATQYGDLEYNEMQKVIDSITFNVDTSLKEKKNSSFFGTVFEKAIIGAVIGASVTLITFLLNKKKKKVNENEDFYPLDDSNIN